MRLKPYNFYQTYNTQVLIQISAAIIQKQGLFINYSNTVFVQEVFTKKHISLTANNGYTLNFRLLSNTI